jgi:hypothetical protein
MEEEDQESSKALKLLPSTLNSPRDYISPQEITFPQEITSPRNCICNAKEITPVQATGHDEMGMGMASAWMEKEFVIRWGCHLL